MLALRRLAMAALVSIAGFSAPLHADELADVSAYLNQMTTAEGPFIQYNADGSTSTGTFSISRPGKMRMDYDGDKSPLLIVGGGRVAIFDRAYRHNRPEQYPLSRTPLGPILARHVDLAQSNLISGQISTEDRIVVSARDPAHPEYGVGQFSFSKEPLELKSWTMTGQTGETTHIEFGTLETGHKISLFQFSVHHEMEKNKRR